MTPSAIHPFETAGLGRAPFRCVGSYESKYQAIAGDPNCPIQPGSSCDYCGQAIMQVFRIKSADGKEFKVGCDCVAKTARACAGTDLERDARRVVDGVNKIKTAVANARKDARILAARNRLVAHRDVVAAMGGVEIAGCRRPALEYLEWMFARAGRAGKLRAAALLDRLLLSAGNLDSAPVG
jgi:hypothetical protein